LVLAVLSITEEKKFTCEPKQTCEKYDKKILVLQGKQYLEAKADSLANVLESQ